MALRELANGDASCGPVNPLAGLAKHFDADNSLHRDIVHGQSSAFGPVRGAELLAGPSRPTLQYEEEFFAQQQQLGRAPFEFGEMNRQLGSIRDQFHPQQRPHREMDGDWASHFLQERMPAAEQEQFEQIYNQYEQINRANTGDWAQDFSQFRPGPNAIPTEQELSEMERAYNEAASNEWAQEYNKPRDTADEWVSEFLGEETKHKAGDDVRLAQLAGELFHSVQDEKMKKSNFMQFMQQLSTGKVKIEDDKLVEQTAPVGGDWATEFAASSSAQRQHMPIDAASLVDEFMDGEHPGNWVQEYSRAKTATGPWEREYELSEQDRQLSAAEGQVFPEDQLSQFQKRYEGQGFDDWTAMYQRSIASLRDEADEEWEKMEKGWQRYPHEGFGYEGYNKELYMTYVFQSQNPYLNHDDPMAEAMDLLNRHIPAQAILALEAELKRNPENAEAWLLLGKNQAMNEKDVLAIAAFQKCLQSQPAMLDGWINMAASYTNENCRPEAFQALEMWIRNHSKYASLIRGPLPGTNHHQDLVNLFLQAARLNPTEIDADVQISLGILFNISGEYDKAIDCFNAAIHCRPTDAFLWNKLGATLANSGKPEQAIDAYYKALEQQPSYIRARFNLGISCIALGAHKEAVEHLLSALAMQTDFSSSSSSSSSDPAMQRVNTTSSNIWDTLRMSFFMMERGDLAARCDTGDINAFRTEFDF